MPAELPPEITVAEYAERVSRVRSRMEEADLDALIVWSRGGGPVERHGDVLYLTGHYALFPTIRDLHGVWSDRGYAAVVLTATTAELCSDDPAATPFAATGHRSLHGAGTGTLAGLVRDAIGAARRVGVCGTEAMTGRQWAELSATLADRELTVVDDLVEQERMVKSSAELQLLRHAGTVADACFRAGREQLHAGNRETDVIAAMVAEATRHEVVVANAFTYTFGAAEPVTPPAPPTYSHRILHEGDLFTVDLSGAYRGYLFDLARSHVVDREPTPAQLQPFALAKESVEASVAAAVPGATVGDVARAAEDVLRDGDFDFDGAEFQAAGHGIGLGFESPWMRREDTRVIRAGMTLALERFVLRDNIGATFERNVVITPDGPEDLAPVLNLW